MRRKKNCIKINDDDSDDGVEEVCISIQVRGI